MSAEGAPDMRPSDIPRALPQGESLLWQGRPAWQALAVRAFHIRKVAFYFALLALWRGAGVLADGGSVAAALATMAWMALPALAGVGVLSGLAWLVARTTHYTITSRRVLLQFGVALPVTLNVPFRIIVSAGCKLNADGTADIPLALGREDRLAYLMLWPHVRPWRLSHAEPMLRSVPNGERVAALLARALAGGRAQPVTEAAPAAPALGPATAAA